MKKRYAPQLSPLTGASVVADSSMLDQSGPSFQT